MKSMKKLFALTLALLMLCSTFISTVFAEGIDTPLIPVPGENDEEIFVSPFYYTLNASAGTATVVGYGGWNTDAVLPASVEYNGATYTVNAIGALAFAADNTITSITLPLTVKAVGANAFRGCTNLSDVWYEGTATDKNGITITATNNTAFTGAIWHYNACIHNPTSVKEHTFDNACDTDCNYCDLTRTVPDHVYDGDKDISCNECGYMRIVPGDVDENNVVTQDDALYLLSHIFFNDRYPVNSHHDPDYDKDGDVDLDDVFYLLYHSYFPERFPIDIVL